MTNVESNVHVKVAMADVLGLFVVSMFTMGVALFGLGSDLSFAMAVQLGPFVGAAALLVAVFAYLNENLLATAIFGPLAMFFFAIVLLPGGISSAALCMTIGIIILIDALIAFLQPVKLLPILLIIAALAFFVTALFYNGSDVKLAMGALWLIYTLLSFYMAAAIMILVLKGKAMLPLLIKA